MGSCRRKDVDPAEIAARVGAAADGRPGSTGPLDVDLVVEAIPEIPAAKRDLLAAAEKVTPPATLLASNTSSLSITELAGALERPERFIGMHFFNPVPLSALVELVVGDGTTAGDRRRRPALGRPARPGEHRGPGLARLRHQPPRRLPSASRRSAWWRRASPAPADIDTGMVLGYKHPMGPLRLTDLVGLDVRLAIAEHLASTLGPRFEPPAAAAATWSPRGDLGKKSGRGFYDW